MKKHKEAFEVLGTAKEEILKRCLEQIQAWGLTMPDDDPLMLHFGLNDFQRIGETEFWICNELDEGYCGKYIFLFEGQCCPEHYHKLKHETFNIIRGEVAMTINGEERILRPGDVLALKVETRHSFAARNGPALLLEVSRPCRYRDSFFEDPNISVF